MTGSSIKPCPHCHNSGPLVSRIRDYVPIQCLRNRKDTCGACQKLSETDRKIEEARRTLNNLLKERESLASLLNDHHDLPTGQLPVEVTSRIFLHCLPPKPTDLTTFKHYNEKRLLKSIFLLGHVSQTWRKVARRTPKLWSIIRITMTRSNCMSSIPFVREWLKLSEGLPLFLQLFVGGMEDAVVSSVSQKVMVLLIQHAHRWKVLNLAVPHHLLPWISSAMPKRHLDYLEHVKLDVTSTSLDDSHLSSVLHFQATPRRLTQGEALLTQLSFNKEHLTHYFAPDYYLDTDECIQLFQSAPRLTVCHLGYLQESAPSNIVVLGHSLQTLMITEPTGDWWNSFTFPSLETLSVIRAEDSWINLHALLQRSGCKLRNLSIKESEYDPDKMEVFKLSPDLQELVLFGDFMRDPFFSLMDAAASSTPCFLKNLTSLTCKTARKEFDWTWCMIFLTTMTTRPEKSLRFVRFQYVNARHLEENTKKIDKSVLDVLDDVVLEVVDGEDTDIGELLRSRHNV